jgi:hypothetical protein
MYILPKWNLLGNIGPPHQEKTNPQQTSHSHAMLAADDHLPQPDTDQPCFCLCLGFSQITITRPLRLIILHFSQIGFTDGRTFMRFTSFASADEPSVWSAYASSRRILRMGVNPSSAT